MKVMSIDNKISLAFFGMLALICFLGSKSIKRNIPLYTPHEYVAEKHRLDSIYVTQEEPNFAKVWLKKKLKAEVNELKIDKSYYDAEAKSYRIDYKFNLKDTTGTSLSDKNAIYKSAWIRMNFKINDGDYKITPEIIKTKAVINKHKK